MKKICSRILFIIFLISILTADTASYLNLSGNIYAAQIYKAEKPGIETGSSGSGTNKKDTEIAPIRKNIPKSPAAPKNVTPVPNVDLIKKSGILNIAFFGLDRRNPNEASRSDTIMVVSIDEKKQKIKVTSLMRDMYIPIPGKGNNRINAAYAFGGPSLAIKTINTNFGLDIKNYVMVDFFGLEKLIDTVGGVTVNVSDAEAKNLNDSLCEVNSITQTKVPGIKGGTQTLNGRQAVAYCRIRYVGHADYERTERQRRVLNEIFRKIKKGGILKLPKTITAINPYVKTNLSVGEIIKLAIKGAGFKTDNIEQYRLPVDGTYQSKKISGMDVLVPNMEQNRKKLYEFIYGIK